MIFRIAKLFVQFRNFDWSTLKLGIYIYICFILVLCDIISFQVDKNLLFDVKGWNLSIINKIISRIKEKEKMMYINFGTIWTYNRIFLSRNLHQRFEVACLSIINFRMIIFFKYFSISFSFFFFLRRVKRFKRQPRTQPLPTKMHTVTRTVNPGCFVIARKH